MLKLCNIKIVKGRFVTKDDIKGKKRTATVPKVPVMCIKNGNGLSADIFSSVSLSSGSDGGTDKTDTDPQ